MKCRVCQRITNRLTRRDELARGLSRISRPVDASFTQPLKIVGSGWCRLCSLVLRTVGTGQSSNKQISAGQDSRWQHRNQVRKITSGFQIQGGRDFSQDLLNSPLNALAS